MDVFEIRQVGRGIDTFLAEFEDCFGRCDTAAYLKVYVSGQNSDLQRKSAEPMALQAGIPPRSLQAFLSLLEWDDERMVDRTQQIVARDHAHPWAIGLVDETPSPKKGDHTAAVQPQWCGRTGKVDNCVVSVHTGYTAGKFHCLLDSDLFLPEKWANDWERRQRARIPDQVTHRTKPQIALAQIKRALANGVRVAAWTFDEHYGQSYEFLDGLDALGQTYVAEVPSDFCGWSHAPQVVHRMTSDLRGKPRKPRLAKTAARVSEVRHLLAGSPAFRQQAWMPIHVKEGEKGPIVREVRVIPFWMHRHGLPTRPHWLIAARDPMDHDQLKFFVSNAPAGTPLEWLVYVAYSRWPIEQCFQEDKDELGFDHFEVRNWRAIHRHMALTQVSHLYLNKMREQLVAQETAQEQAGLFFPAGRRRRPPAIPRGELDSGSDSLRRVGLAEGTTSGTARPGAHLGKGFSGDLLSPCPQCRSQAVPPQENGREITSVGYRFAQNTDVRR